MSREHVRVSEYLMQIEESQRVENCPLPVVPFNLAADFFPAGFYLPESAELSART